MIKHEKKTQDFSTSISETSENAYLFASISWLVSFWICIYIKYSIYLMYKYLLELIKRKSNVQEKNMSCERIFNFYQWKTFSENYNPIRVSLRLVYKFTKNNCPLRLFSEFIQIQKRYLTFLDKTRCQFSLRDSNGSSSFGGFQIIWP